MTKRWLARYTLLAWFGVMSGLIGHRGPMSLAQGPRLSPPSGPAPKAEGHWGEDQVGFRWVESDSADGRWNQTDTGPFLASSLPTPSGIVQKAVSVRLGRDRSAAICFDTARMSFCCAWSGGFLQFTPARFGVIAPPTIAGQVQFCLPDRPLWSGAALRYEGLRLQSERVIFQYSVDGMRVLESCMERDDLAHYPGNDQSSEPEIPGSAADDAASSQPRVLVRSIRLEPHPVEQRLVVADGSLRVTLVRTAEQLRLERRPDGLVELVIGPHDQPIGCDLRTELAPDAEVTIKTEHARPFADHLPRWSQAGPARWGEPLVTQGHCGPDDRAYVIDTVDLPLANRFNALFFLSGHDFFAEAGQAAVCTLHGDVWWVDGLDAGLRTVRWKRFATGLYQPLGLKIVADQVYVLGRDQITRLHDENGDGEADWYECFHNHRDTSAGGHDYSTCLETDSTGRFYYVSPLGVQRISADGRDEDTIATGLRNPNGMGIGPDDLITVAPQEGDWTPASGVFEVTAGGYYGFGGPRTTPTRPLGYDRPLFWLPRQVDNSTGGQVWAVPSWGPLADKLLVCSLGQCRVLVSLLEPTQRELPAHWPITAESRVLRVLPEEQLVPPDARYLQGGCYTLPGMFASGIMRGRFAPWDGQLYLSGLRGWVSAATQDGCLQRVRYTGRESCLPVGVVTLANGLALSFSTTLDPSAATDPGAYSVERWNYRYGPEYGSAEYAVSAEQRPGRETVSVRSVSLLDAKTVFLELDEMVPAMQMELRYVVGSPVGVTRGSYYHTVHQLPSVGIDVARVGMRTTARSPAARETDLAAGVLWEFSDRRGPRVRRSLDLALPQRADDLVGAGTRPDRDPFHAKARGYLRVPVRDRYTFLLTGQGRVTLRMNGDEVIAGFLESDEEGLRRTVALRQGDNLVELEYETSTPDEVQVSVEWMHADFAWEPIPSTAWRHDVTENAARQAHQLQAGWELVRAGRCQRCHQNGAESADKDRGRPAIALSESAALPRAPDGEQGLDAPELNELQQRLSPAWIAQWLVDPSALLHGAEMPRVLAPHADVAQQEALDLAAFLTQDPTAWRRDGAVAPAEQPVRSESVRAFRSSGAVAVHAPDSQAEQDRWISEGARLYAAANCAVCHVLGDHEETYDRRTLRWVGAKFPAGGLRAFLLAPQARYRERRMPDFALTESEATALAAFLMAQEQGRLADWTEAATGDPNRGAQLFVTYRCAACHPRSGHQHALDQPQEFGAPDLAGLDVTHEARGCLASEHQGGAHAPSYRYTAEQQAAIRIAVREWVTDGHASQRLDDAERAASVMRRWQCTRCHDRDGELSVRWEIDAEEGDGRPLEILPELTWTGDKLNSAWLRDYLAGERPVPVRPWLSARMPRFPWHAQLLADGLALQHGHLAGMGSNADDPTTTDRIPAEMPSEERLTAGRVLLTKEGLDCRQCHAVGEERPLGDDRTQFAPGIDLLLARERLRGSYYRRFTLDPPRIDPRTRMPKLAPDGRTTSIRKYWEGDAAQQFAAIWDYLGIRRSAERNRDLDKAN